jgi:diguanylate cyclase (GGDEF)-like protein
MSRTRIDVPHGPGDRGQRLQQALTEVSDLTAALRASQHALQSARVQLETLRGLNAHLNRQLVELAKKEAQARDFGYHDELTRLPNRRLLRDRLDQALAQAARQHKAVALLLVDLDGFKGINDRLGHARGDQLLQAVALRLQLNVRAADTACRYGGDEFVVMLPEVDSVSMVAAVAVKLRAAMNAPYRIDGFEVRVTASIGSVVYPNDGDTYEQLIRRADEALYRAKPEGREAAITPLASATAREAGSARRCRPGRGLVS